MRYELGNQYLVHGKWLATTVCFKHNQVEDVAGFIFDDPYLTIPTGFCV